MPEIANKSEEQKDTESEGFQGDLGPFVAAAEATRMAMVFSGAKGGDNPIIFATDGFLSLTWYAREEVLGQSFAFLKAHVANVYALAQMNFPVSQRSGDG